MSLAYSYPSPHPQPILPRGHPLPSGHAVAQPMPAYHPGNYILPPGTAFPPPTPQSASFHPAMMAAQQFAVSMASAGPAAASPTPSSATNRSGKSKFEAPLSPPPSSPMQGSVRASSAASSRPATASKPGPAKAKSASTRKRPNKSGSNAASRSETILSVRERKRAGGAGSGPRGSIAASSSGGSSNPPTPNPSGAGNGNPSLGEGWIAGAPMMTPSLTNGSTAASFSPETSFTASMSRPLAMSRSSMGSQAPKARTLGLAFGGVAAKGEAGSMDALMANQAAKRVAGPSMLPPPPNNRERSLSGASSSSHPVSSGNKTQRKATAGTKKANVEYIPSALVTPPPQHRQIPPVQHHQNQQRHATPATTPTTARPPLPGNGPIVSQAQPYPTPRYTEAALSASIPASVMYATPTRAGGDGTGDEGSSGRTSEAEAERAMMDRLESEKREIMSQLAKYGVHPTPAVFSAALVLVSERQAADPSRPPPTIDDFTAALRHVEAVQARHPPLAPAGQPAARRGRKPGVKKGEEKGKARAMTPVIVIEQRSAVKLQKPPTPVPVALALGGGLSVPRIEVVAAAAPSPRIIAMPPAMPRLDEPLVLSFGPDGKATLRPASLAPAPVTVRAVPVVEEQLAQQPVVVVEPTPDPARAKRMQAFASPSMPGSSDFPTGIGAPGPLVMATNELVAAEVPGRGRVKCERAELVRGLGEEGAALAIAAAAASPGSKGPMDEAWRARNQVWTPPSSAPDGSQAAGPSTANKNAAWPDTIRRFGGVVDHKSRIGRIEAWLESPDVGDRSEHDDGHGFWTTLPSEWYETEEKEAMDRARTRAALRRYASGQEGDEVEEYVTISGGKTLRRLVRYRKRAYDADSIDAAEAEAASAKRHCSERRMTETEKVSCICTKGDDETAMVQCDGCRVWYHLACLDISEDDELPDEWHCFRCTRGPAPPRANRYRPEPTLVHVSYSPRVEHFYGSSAPHHLALAPSPMPAPTGSSAPNTRPVSRTAHVLASPIIHAPPHATSQWVTPTMNPGGFVDWSRVNYSPRSPVHRRSHRFASMAGTPGMGPYGLGPSPSDYAHQDEFDQAFPWAGPFTTPRTASGFPGQWDEDVVERRASIFYPPGTPVRAGHVFATPSTWRHPAGRPHHHPQDYPAVIGLRSPGDVPSSPPQGHWSPIPTAQPSKSRSGHRRHGSGSVSFATPPAAAHYRPSGYGYSPNLGAGGPYARSSHARSAVFGNSGPSSAAVAAAAKLGRDGDEQGSPSASPSRSGSGSEKRSSHNATPTPKSLGQSAAQGKNQAGLGIGFGEGEEDLNQFLGL